MSLIGNYSVLCFYWLEGAQRVTNEYVISN